LDELVMAWATDRDSGAAKYILEVDRGLRCSCVCPACGSALEAVNSRNPNWRKRPHFRHTAGTETEDCAVLAARQAILRALADLGDTDGQSFDLPGRTRSVEAQGLSGTIYTGTASAPAIRVLPEAVRLVDAQSAAIRLDDGREVLVQVVATLERSSDLPAEHRAIIQVVASRAELSALAGLSPKEVRERLRVLLSDGRWCRHWDDDALDAAAAQSANDEAARYIDDSGVLEGEEGASSYESALHLAVKFLIAESKAMQLPALEARVERDVGTTAHWVRNWSTDPWRATFSDVRLEKRLGRAVPDVVAEGPDGTICIEVTVANPLDSSREERYEALAVAVLEIDLRVFSGRVTRDELRAIVVDGLQGKRWVHHPRQAAEQRKLADAYEAEVGRYKQMRLRQLVDEARDRALAFYDADFDSSLQPPLLRALRVLENRGFTGAATLEFYGHARLLPRLVSISLGRPVGYRFDSVFEVVNAIAQSQNLHWAPLFLMALRVYNPPMSDKHRARVTRWRGEVVELVRAHDQAVSLPSHLDQVIGLFFPELVEPLAQFRVRTRRSEIVASGEGPGSGVAAVSPRGTSSGPDAVMGTGATAHVDPAAGSGTDSGDSALASAAGKAAGAGRSPRAFAQEYANRSGWAVSEVLKRLRLLGFTNSHDFWN
jgi:hypothetical protein